MIFDVRRQRREGILLTVISAMFVAAGVFLVFVVGNSWLGAIAISFFGAGLLIGVFQTLRPGQDLPLGLAITSCFAIALSGVVLILTELLGNQALGPRQGAALPVGIIVVIFFGGGGILLLIRLMRR